MSSVAGRLTTGNGGSNTSAAAVVAGQRRPPRELPAGTSLTLAHARDVFAFRRPNSPSTSVATLPPPPPGPGPAPARFPEPRGAGLRALEHPLPVLPWTCPMQLILGDAGRSPARLTFFSSCAFCHTAGDRRSGE